MLFEKLGRIKNFVFDIVFEVKMHPLWPIKDVACEDLPKDPAKKETRLAFVGASLYEIFQQEIRLQFLDDPDE